MIFFKVALSFFRSIQILLNHSTLQQSDTKAKLRITTIDCKQKERRDGEHLLVNQIDGFELHEPKHYTQYFIASL